MSAGGLAPTELFAQLHRRITRPSRTKLRQHAVAALAGERAWEHFWQNELISFRGGPTPVVRYRGREYLLLLSADRISLVRRNGRFFVPTTIKPYSYGGFVEMIRSGKIFAPAHDARW